MGFKRALNSRMAAVGVGAAALALLAGGAGYAAGQIDSGDIKDNSVRSVDVKDGDLKLKDFSEWTKESLQGEDGKDGRVALADFFQSATAQTINNIGGPFAANKTELGSITLEPGVYVLNAFAAFDTVTKDSERTDATRLMLALRGPTSPTDNFGEDFATCFTGKFAPMGVDRESTCQATRTVAIEATTEIRVIAFGYNDDASGVGGESFTAKADVSALKVS